MTSSAASLQKSEFCGERRSCPVACNDTLLCQSWPMNRTISVLQSAINYTLVSSTSHSVSIRCIATSHKTHVYLGLYTITAMWSWIIDNGPESFTIASDAVIQNDLYLIITWLFNYASFKWKLTIHNIIHREWIGNILYVQQDMHTPADQLLYPYCLICVIVVSSDYYTGLLISGVTVVSSEPAQKKNNGTAMYQQQLTGNQ